MKYQPIAERFVSKFEPDPQSGCWNWTGSKIKGGYGVLGGERGANNVVAHKFSYEHHKGPVPSDMLVLHRCDNPGCVNPDHLFLGTHADNMDDMAKKGRAGAPKGRRGYVSKLSDDQKSEMRALVSAGVPIRQVAAKFGVDRRLVRKYAGASQARTSNGASWLPRALTIDPLEQRN